MKVRICPLCDQPMKKAHRCDSCNSFIWKPEYVDIHYNTDTVHGDDCSYDSQAHDYKYRDDGSVTMMPSRKKRKARAAENSEWTTDNSTTADTYKKYKKTYKMSGKTYSDGTVPERRGASGKAKLIIILVVVFSIISAAAEVIGTLEKKMTADISGIFSDDSIRATEDYFAEDEGDDWAASDEDIGRVEYSDEEVAALGSECTGFEHMDITVDEFMAVLEPELSKLGMDTKSFQIRPIIIPMIMATMIFIPILSRNACMIWTRISVIITVWPGILSAKDFMKSVIMFMTARGRMIFLYPP